MAAVALLALVPSARAQRSASRADRFVDSVLARMTLEDKVGQLMQYRGHWSNTGPLVPAGGEAEIRAGRVGSFLGVYGATYTRQLQRVAVEESPRRIPLLFAHDVVHGFRTMFPVPLASASSWNPALVERAAHIAAVEATAVGLHWTFAPMVDIARDPRWGRIVEGAGEDPYLGSAMAAAQVRGFQARALSRAVPRRGVAFVPPGAPRVDAIAATAKHFVAYGAAEGGRDYNVAEVSPQTLRDVYLPPFQAAVAAGSWSVMPGFNEIAGVPMHANRALIGGVLRGEWGWDGLVVSDYTGVRELIPHGVAADSAQAAEKALHAGVDVDMVSGIYLDAVPALVRAGRLDARDVDAAVRRLLRLKVALGLFADPYRLSDTSRARVHLLTPSHRATARELATQSIILLKNDSVGGSRVLPLRRTIGTLAVIGALAIDGRSAIGNWAAAGRADEAVTVLDGIRRAVSPGTRVVYARGADVVGADTLDFDHAVAVARDADAVVLVVGERENQSAEANSRASLDLPGVQEALVRRIAGTGKPLALVLMNGRPLAVSWEAEHVPAIVESWFLGTETGTALADVLFGAVNPSAKLTVTIPRATGQVPVYYNHRNTGRPPRSTEKYTSKYNDLPWTPLYPFGHGLSYSTFAYANLRLSSSRMRVTDSVVASVDVTNTGERAGDEIVQLYLRDEVGSLTRPVRELRGFRRVTLAPHDTRRVSFVLGALDMAFTDEDQDLVIEPGFFRVQIGTSSEQWLERRLELVDGRHCAKLVLPRSTVRFEWDAIGAPVSRVATPFCRRMRGSERH